MVQDNAKKIIAYMLEQAISSGDISRLFIRYDTLTKKLNLVSENLCRVCCQYLDELGYIKIIRNDDGNRFVELKAKGIDFLESK